MGQVTLLIATALISGLLATIVTIYWQRKTESYSKKYNVFNTLMSYRYMISSEGSVNAMNTIDVIFYKEQSVRLAYRAFLEETLKTPANVLQIEEKHLKLLEAMAKVLKLDNIHWDEIKHYYYPIGLSEKLTEEASLRKLQIKNVASNLNSSSKAQNAAGNHFAEQLVLQILPDLLEHPEKADALVELSKRIKDKS